ncbi:unnamed protein product [Meloidogyne enterolobii]|uniref:Uncharacterized protein n=1 Tax=Meloidogyne enterolobii TaxID=390850 RepID=A0ACB0Z561_MELEN
MIEYIFNIICALCGNVQRWARRRRWKLRRRQTWPARRARNRRIRRQVALARAAEWRRIQASLAA